MKKSLALRREIFSFPHLIWLKIRHKKNFKCNFFQDISISTRFYYEGISEGKIRLGKAVHTKRNVEINVSKNASIEIGSHTCINNNCYIAALEHVSIGERCQIAPGVIIVDHDHDYKVTRGISEGKYKCAPIMIGNDVWIGANTVILKGTVIGNGVVIGAGSVVRGNIPNDTILVQKRIDNINKIERN